MSISWKDRGKGGREWALMNGKRVPPELVTAVNIAQRWCIGMVNIVPTMSYWKTLLYVVLTIMKWIESEKSQYGPSTYLNLCYCELICLFLGINFVKARVLSGCSLYRRSDGNHWPSLTQLCIIGYIVAI